MTPDEHQRERMATWRVARCRVGGFADGADELLAEFDKRFPAPASPSEPKVQAAVEPVPAEPPMLFARTLAAMEERDAAAELAALREKARLFDKLCEELPPGWKQNLRYWDAVASGKVRLVAAIGVPSVWWADYGTQPGKYTASTRNFHTAAEAVQAAIDAGALK